MFHDHRHNMPATLTMSESGFIAHESIAKQYAIPFSSIGRIVAFKRDLLTTDLVCLEIQYLGADNISHRIEINEEMPGFDNITDALERLPGADKKWRERVLNPPYATNETTLFEKADVNEEQVQSHP